MCGRARFEKSKSAGVKCSEEKKNIVVGVPPFVIRSKIADVLHRHGGVKILGKFGPGKAKRMASNDGGEENKEENGES